MAELLPPQDKVLTFNPEAYLVLDSADTFGAGDQTISLWLSWVPPDYQDPAFASYATSPDSATILNYDETPDGSQRGSRFWITNPSNLEVWVGGSSVRPSRKVDVSDGDWHHLAVTVSRRSGGGYDIEIFHNGASHGGGSITEGQVVSGSQLVLGQRYFGELNDQFIGQFADFAVWNRIRSPSQIQSDMNDGITGTQAGLVMHWKLNEAPPGTTHANLVFVDTGGEDFGFNF